VLAVCYLVAIVSAGIMAVSAVLDRRRAYALLRLAGTPLAVLDRAWLQETLIPLAVMGGGSLLAGLVCAAPFALAGLLEPYGLVMLAAFACIGTLGIVAANLASRPLLRAVTTDPSPQPD
ncbi:MAG: FtsX-like permease family protein, partial [Streptosporangiales bacterium]